MTKGLLQENNQNGRPWTAGREGEKTEGPGAGGGGREKGRVPGRGFFLKGACLGESELEGCEVWSGWKFGDETVSNMDNVWGVTLGVGSWVE